MITFSNFGRSRLCLGYEGENIVREITVDVSDELHEGWSAGLMLKRPDGLTYQSDTTLVDGVMRHKLTSDDLAVNGFGMAMIFLLGGDGEIKKSATAITCIKEALPALRGD